MFFFTSLRFMVILSSEMNEDKESEKNQGCEQMLVWNFILIGNY